MRRGKRYRIRASKPRPVQQAAAPWSKGADKDGVLQPRVKVRPRADAARDDDIEPDEIGFAGADDPAFDLPGFIAAAARAAGLPDNDNGSTEDADDNDNPATETNGGEATADSAGGDDVSAQPAQGATAAVLPPDDERPASAKLKRVSPTGFLRAVMRHPEVPMHLRLEVAAILAPYFHAKPLPAPPPQHLEAFEIEDDFGFTVDLALAKTLYDLQQASDNLSHQTTKDQGSYLEQRDELEKKLTAAKKPLRCPDRYRWEDVARDQQRLNELGKKAGGRKPPEEAEALHLNARILSHENSEEHAERNRKDAEMRALRERIGELYWKWVYYEIDDDEQKEFDRLRSVPIARLSIGEFDFSITHPETDPVLDIYHHQLCTEARYRGQPEPSREDVAKLLAAKGSSAEIPRYARWRKGPAEKRQPTDEIDFAAWLRGEIAYEPWRMRKAVHERLGTYYPRTIVPELMIGLVRDHKIVPDDELVPYFGWLLRLRDEAIREGRPLP
jgi:hypothetical protein